MTLWPFEIHLLGGVSANLSTFTLVAYPREKGKTQNPRVFSFIPTPEQGWTFPGILFVVWKDRSIYPGDTPEIPRNLCSVKGPKVKSNTDMSSDHTGLHFHCPQSLPWCHTGMFSDVCSTWPFTGLATQQWMTNSPWSHHKAWRLTSNSNGHFEFGSSKFVHAYFKNFIVICNAFV